MTAAQKFFLLVFLSASVLFATQFGTVSIDLLPGTLSQISLEDYHCFSFQIRNQGLQPADISLVLDVLVSRYYHGSAIGTIQASKSTVLTPGASRTLSLNAAALQFLAPKISSSSDFYSYYELTVTVDGKAYHYGLEELRTASNADAKNLALLTNSLPAEIFSEIFAIGSFYHDLLMVNFPESIQHWPDNPQFYSGKRVIICSSEDNFPPAVRQLLREWVFAGGTLITCLPPEQSWAENYSHLPDGVEISNYGWGTEIFCQPFTREQQNKIAEYRKNKPSPSIGIKKIPIPEISSVWQTLNQKVLLYSHRQPFSAKALLSNANQYLSLPVPEVKTASLFFIMLVFIIVIGPVNYYIFQRKKKKLWLLLSTPILSAVFCLIIILFITFSEGWSATGQYVAITLLDQNNNLANTKAVCGIYSSIILRQPFRFTDQDCLVFNNIEKYHLLDEPGQVFSSSFVRSRIPVYYTVNRTENRQEKLRFKAVPEGLEVSNGLGGRLEHLVVRWSENTIYKNLSPIDPGAKVILTTALNNTLKQKSSSPQEISSLCEQILRKKISLGDLQTLTSYLPVGYYSATTSEPLFYSPGRSISSYSNKQLIIGF